MTLEITLKKLSLAFTKEEKELRSCNIYIK